MPGSTSWIDRAAGMCPTNPAFRAAPGANRTLMLWVCAILDERSYGVIGVVSPEETHMAGTSLTLVGNAADSFLSVEYMTETFHLGISRGRLHILKPAWQYPMR